MDKRIGKITIAFFLANIIFWLGIFFYYSLVRFKGEGEYLIVKILLLCEPVIFSAALLGYYKKWRLFPVPTLLFLGANAILSLADEVGLYDIISLVLSGGLFVLLVLQGRVKEFP